MILMMSALEILDVAQIIALGSALLMQTAAWLLALPLMQPILQVILQP